MALWIAVNGKYNDYQPPSPLKDFKSHNIKRIGENFDKYLEGEEVHENEPSNKKIKKHPLKEYAKNEAPKHKRNILFAKDIMSSPLHSVDINQTGAEALALMEKYKIHHLPLVDKENELLLGMISDRDLLGIKDNLQDKNLSMFKKDVIVCGPEAPLPIISRIMIYENIHAIIVINEDKKIDGIVTSFDILKCVMNNMPLEVWI